MLLFVVWRRCCLLRGGRCLLFAVLCSVFFVVIRCAVFFVMRSSVFVAGRLFSTVRC